MTHSQAWDLEKYSSPHEPKHHWQLKKKFMEHHKDRFPERELVSLNSNQSPSDPVFRLVSPKHLAISSS